MNTQQAQALREGDQVTVDLRDVGSDIDYGGIRQAVVDRRGYRFTAKGGQWGNARSKVEQVWVRLVDEPLAGRLLGVEISRVS